MVGRPSASAAVSRRATQKRPRGVFRSADEAARRENASASSVNSRLPQEESLIRRCKQMSAIVAASVAVACISIGYALWQASASQSAVDQATRGAASVLVASRDVKAGELLDEAFFEARSVPEAYRSSAALLVEDGGAVDRISGARALVDIPAGSQLCGTYLVGAGSDGRLAAQLEAGMEAVSLSVDDETGVAGQVKPYDVVRIVSIEEASSGAMDLQVLAERARVVAVGGDGYADGASYSAIVAEVFPDEADDIRQAQVSGRVSVQLLPSEGISAGGLSG